MTVIRKTTLELYFSYSHQDEAMLEEIISSLTMLQREHRIAVWYDRMIDAGKMWEVEISQHLTYADIILLLISENYLKSDFLYQWEMPRIMDRYARDEVTVIPVLLSPCDWHRAPFGRLQPLPKNGVPITEWKDRKAAFRDVAKNIEIGVDNILTRQISQQLLAQKALLTAVLPDTMSQAEKEEELKKVEEELKANFEQRVTNEVKERTGVLRSTSNIFTALAAISLSGNLIGLFEFLIYKIPFQWLIGHPNSYSLQASFDTLLILLVIGTLYPKWRKWCWGGGAFAVVIVLIQILGGPPAR